MTTPNPTSKKDIVEILAELSPEDDTTIGLYRKGATGRYIYVARLGYDTDDPLDFIERLHERYGGGVYQFRVLDGSKYRTSSVVEFAGPVKEAAASAPAPAPAGPPAPDTAPAPDPMDVRIEGAVERALERFAPGGRRDDGSGMLEAMTAAVGMATAMSNANAPIIKAMLERERSDSSEAVRMMLEGVELGKQMAEGGGGDYASVVAPIAQLFARAVGAPPEPDTPPLTLPPPPERAPLFLDVVGNYLPTLHMAAVAGLEPRDVSETLMELLGTRRDLLEELQRPDIVEILVAAHPPLEPHASYIADVLELLEDPPPAGDVVES